MIYLGVAIIGFVLGAAVMHYADETQIKSLRTLLNSLSKELHREQFGQEVHRG